MPEPDNRKCSLAMFCGKTSLFILMTGYALLGALLFRFLESGGDKEGPTVDFHRSREDCLKELWIITERLNVLYEKNWTKLVTEQLKKFEKSVVESARHEDLMDTKWNFGGSLLYTVTLLTTVGYGRLKPHTVLGKLIAIIYAIIGVPLMLILLSEMGRTLAHLVRRGYGKLCCHTKPAEVLPSVGYHKNNHHKHEDTASIQLASTHTTPNHVTFQTNKKAVLATVRANHTRCRGVRQVLTDPNCPTHHGQSIVGISTDIELDEVEDEDQCSRHCHQHDTPSRIPLIWRPPDKNNGVPPPIAEEPPPRPPPPVPLLMVIAIFFSYIAIGAVCFSNTRSWTFVDGVYFCFLAISTIGVGERVPSFGQDLGGQLQVLACCVYIFVGLVVMAMCFSLVQEELTIKCRQLAHCLGLSRR